MSSEAESDSIFSSPAHHTDSHSTQPPPQSRQTTIVHPPRQPRLSSPRNFRHIFDSIGSSTATRTLPQAEVRESFTPFSRALTAANRAVQNAEQAFQPPAIVDLTDSPPRQPLESDMPPRRRVPQNPVPEAPRMPQQPSDDEVERLTDDHILRLFGRSRPPVMTRSPPNYLFGRPHDPTQAEIREDEDRAIQEQRRARATWRQQQERARQSQPQSQPESRPSSSSSAQPTPSVSEIESIDLTQVDDKANIASTLARPRQDAIASQKTISEVPATARSVLTAYKCPICMETPKDATTTICGHLFCHRCIIDTLKWSETQRTIDMARKTNGVCPVCRKPLTRKEKSGTGRHIIPLQMKLVVEKREDVKGKKRAREDSVASDRKGRKRERTSREQSAEIWRDLTAVMD